MDVAMIDPGGLEMTDRGKELREPDEVAAMVRLNSLGWGVRRIASELGCSHMMVRRYLTTRGWCGGSWPRRRGQRCGLRRCPVTSRRWTSATRHAGAAACLSGHRRRHSPARPQPSPSRGRGGPHPLH
jgi:hypothetical protein